MRFAFIHVHTERFYIVTTMYRVLVVSKAEYYASIRWALSARAQVDARLLATVEQVFRRTRQHYRPMHPR